MLPIASFSSRLCLSLLSIVPVSLAPDLLMSNFAWCLLLPVLCLWCLAFCPLLLPFAHLKIRAAKRFAPHSALKGLNIACPCEISLSAALCCLLVGQKLQNPPQG